MKHQIILTICTLLTTISGISQAETTEQTSQRHRRAQAQSCQSLYLDGQKGQWDAKAGMCVVSGSKEIRK